MAKRILSVGWLVLAVVGAIAQAQDNVESTLDYNNALIRWDRDRLMASYKARHADVTEGQIQLLESYFKLFDGFLLYANPGGPSASNVCAGSSTFYKNKLEDPLLRDMDRFASAEDRSVLPAPMETLGLVYASPDRGVPYDMCALFQLEYVRCVEVHGKKGVGQDGHQECLDSIVLLLKDHEYSDLEQRFLADRLSWMLDEDRMPLPMHEALPNMLLGIGDKNKWLVEFVLGKNELEAAWQCRGHNWASKVTEEGRQGFERHLRAAYVHLRGVYDMRPDSPEAASELINVVLGGRAPKEETPRYWFDRAVKAQFDYMPAYEAYLNTLRARWGGSNEQVLEFGKECAKAGRFDTRVPYMLYRALEELQVDVDDRARLWADNYPALRDVFNSLADADPTPEMRNVDLTRLILLARGQRKAKDSFDALTKLGDPAKLSSALLSRYKLTPSQVTEDIWAFGGPGGDGLRDAITKLNDKKYDEATAAAQAVRKSTSAEPPYMRKAVAAKTAPVLLMARLGKGEVASPEFAEDLPGWRAREGKWTPLGEDGIKVEGMGTLIGLAPLGRKYEVSLDLSIAAPATPKDHDTAASIGLGWHVQSEYEGDAFSVGITRKGATTALQITGRTPLRKPLDAHEPPYHVVVQVWGEQSVVRVDTQTVFMGPVTFEKTREPSGDRMGLRCVQNAEFSNIKVRLLDERPKELPPEADPKPPVTSAAPAPQPGPAPEPPMETGRKPRF